jgi:hypothetical protein
MDPSMLFLHEGEDEELWGSCRRAFACNSDVICCLTTVTRKSPGRLHFGLSGLLPSDLLYHILGVGHTGQHPVGNGKKQRPMFAEDLRLRLTCNGFRLIGGSRFEPDLPADEMVRRRFFGDGSPPNSRSRFGS